MIRDTPIFFQPKTLSTDTCVNYRTSSSVKQGLYITVVLRALNCVKLTEILCFTLHL